MTKINLYCDCGKIHEVNRTDVPDNAVIIKTNFCPDCSDDNNMFEYEERYYDSDEDIDIDDPKQTVLFSIADEFINKPVNIEGLHLRHKVLK